MVEFLHQHLNIWNTMIYLVVFTILFILMDEYIAKPYRHRQMEKRAEHDPHVREALRISAEVHERVKKGELSG